MPEPSALFEEIDRIRAQTRVDSARQVEKWRSWRIDPDFLPAAENLAAYLALRHFDLRAVQRDLMTLGLSSLGRLESRVLPTLDAVAAALAALAGREPGESPDEAAFFAGERELLARSRALFGDPAGDRLTVPARDLSLDGGGRQRLHARSGRKGRRGGADQLRP